MRLVNWIFRFCFLGVFAGGIFVQGSPKSQYPQIVLNQGMALVAPAGTLPAIDAAIDHHFEWVNLVVQLTRDHRHVVLHDSSLTRSINGAGAVSNFTLAELLAVDFGSWFAPRFTGTQISTLQEILEYCHSRINILLECREIEPAALVQEIFSAGMAQQVLIAARPEIRQEIQQISGNALVLIADFREHPVEEYWGKNSPAVLRIPFESVTSGFLLAMKQKNTKILVNCFDQADQPQTWLSLKKLAVDWILTNKGDEILAAYLENLAGAKKPVLISAHRGVLALAPENTITAYQKAIDLGLDFIEIDVRPTRDHKMVSVHDRSLKRTTGVDREVNALSLAEIQELSAGKLFGKPFEREKVPTLAEIFQLGRGKIGFYVDFKDGDPAQLVELMRQFEVLDDCVIYGSLEQLLAIRKFAPRAKIMPRLKNSDQIESLITKCQPYAFDTEWNILSPELIKTCRNRGVKVFADAMGGHENIDDFCQAIEWGIDCIQTDEPLILFRAVEKFLNND